MQMYNLVLAAIKDKAPELHKQLAAKGELTQYVKDLAEQINSEIVSMTQSQRMRGKWDNLGPVECARRMKTAESLNQETVLAEMLEFPQDETFPLSQDETPSLDPPT